MRRKSKLVEATFAGMSKGKRERRGGETNLLFGPLKRNGIALSLFYPE